jgi:hypothetical protein
LESRPSFQKAMVKISLKNKPKDHLKIDASLSLPRSAFLPFVPQSEADLKLWGLKTFETLGTENPEFSYVAEFGWHIMTGMGYST